MALLTKPQIQPTIGNAPSVKNWADMQKGFGGIYQLLRGLALYLQTYLTKVYNAVVPTQFVVVTVAHSLSPYSVGGTESFIAASAGASADTTIDLPSATGSGRFMIVSKEDAHAHNVIIAAAAGDLINGAATYDLTSQYQIARLEDLAANVWRLW